MPTSNIPTALPKLIGALTVVNLGYVWYSYNQHSDRDIGLEERQKAHQCLDRLSGSGSTQQDVLRSHLHNLDKYGVTHIRSVLSAESAAKWDAAISKQLAKKDGTCVVPPGGALGRTHCQLLKRKTWQRKNNPDQKRKCLDTLHDSLVMVSDAYCNAESEDTRINVTLSDIAQEYFSARGIAAHRYELVQLQLLNAEPGSTHQIWHRDNTQPGLTVIVAIRNVASNGPTELLLRSHRGDTKESIQTMLWPDRTSEHGKDYSPRIHERMLLASIQKGDAILYDARCLHRGRGYAMQQIGNEEALQFGHRPVLVIRWDAKKTPAPGTALIGTTLAVWEGKARAFACTVLSWVDGD